MSSSATPTDTTRRQEERNSCSDTKWDADAETFFMTKSKLILFGVYRSVGAN